MPEYCTCCGVPLTGRIRWLELDQRTQTFTVDPVPPEYSQGGFPFGTGCAKRKLAEHKQKAA